MRKYFANFDWFLFLAALVLLTFSLVMIASVASQLFFPQFFYAFLGLLLFFIFSQIDYRFFEKLASFFFVGSLGFLLIPLFLGIATRGARRWIQLGFLTLQPSELVKPFLIIFFASFFSSREMSLKEVMRGIFFLLLPIILVFLQPDLGSSLVLFFSWLGVVLGSGLSWRLIILGFLLLLFFFPWGWYLLQDYQRQRILSFLNPLSDPLRSGYHLIQTTVAVGSGQWFGRGWGRGTQSHLRFLPERHTDFIFASLAEELGFFGAAILILLFAFLLWRILVISQKARDLFGFLLCLGIFSLFFIQILVNIGMNLGLLPITGITLPLISYGGSSLVTTMISLGIVANIARLKKREEAAMI